MADAAYQQYYAAPQQGAAATVNTAARTNWVNWVGAAMSLGLILGLLVWTYQLTVRDVADIPVIRAQEGLMRVQPADPGGLRAAHQGLSVNGVQSEGVAARPAERIVLAPSALTLEDEDLSGERQAIDLGAAANASQQGLSAEQASMPRDGALPNATLRPGILPASVPGVRVSPRPAHRPLTAIRTASRQVVAEETVLVDGGTLAADPVEVAAASTAQAVSDGVEVAAASLPAGTRMVQLGAFDSRDTALVEWNKINGQFVEYMYGKQRVVQMAQSGGKTFYRLRAVGFDGLSDARRFCTVLLADNAACIPVVSR